MGVEINAKWVQETQTFIVKYMKNGRFKHKVTKEKRTGAGGKRLLMALLCRRLTQKKRLPMTKHRA
ncbi:hypothetical protein JCM19231_360 [Vibrio ishigakensis]|uniref:Uncharacterized protein n=1 Tax=Vibrio ishigakensis TaxID=1481914 RepID=A0A0B8NU43_9VIBR|nr:hypothetical protein JCM19231_360 [Vibrio ishigakensis]